MKPDSPPVIHLKDYTPPDITIASVNLIFDLSPKGTRVESLLQITRKEGSCGDVTLDGEALQPEAIEIDGQPLEKTRFRLTESGLTLFNTPKQFALRTIVTIDPVDNTRLEGLYQSNGTFCTQCEAEGFRRITFFPDRPDIMSLYSVTIRASRTDYPVLLSNGNCIRSRNLEAGRHETVWEDPFPKPSYLFALVAGRLDVYEDTFTTCSGRSVDLKIWVDPGNAPRCAYAMDALKRAMKWDEDRFALEYDLDIFNIVAVSDFNMGAMENKSLNVFNAKYILADSQTATDADFANIESIVGHEYFHNWTGNRVTCRDWFQLSLKEGLTVFRDQEFSADMRSHAVQRIQDVRMLRARQFSEDAGPLAHPVRPESYMEINNFYTATVYEKGAEVIRLQHALLGEDGFQKGMKLYFERHDGQAVTCDDFVAAMADANNVDLSSFKPWYSQAGTPEVTARWHQDLTAQTFTLSLHQETKPTPHQPDKHPLPIPLRIALIGEDGREHIPETTVILREESRDIIFETVPFPVTPSINRGFSAPILLKADYSLEERIRLMSCDSDPFARWEAGFQFGTLLLLDMVQALREGRDASCDMAFIEAIGHILKDSTLDPAYKALAVSLPGEEYIGDQTDLIYIDDIHTARQQLRKTIAEIHKNTFATLYETLSDPAEYDPGAQAAGRRALRNAALAYLGLLEEPDAIRRAKIQFDMADNMTDRMAALGVLSHHEGTERTTALNTFLDHYREDEQVMDKWLSVQAMSDLPDVLDHVITLSDHPVFNMRKPNKVRALIGAFAMGNPAHFHKADGSGYRFVIDKLIELDQLNPQVTARMLGLFGQWRRLPKERGLQMKAELQRLASVEGLSRDCTEIAGKALQDT